ncbi:MULTISPECIES: TspO/MBR family protein [unclassified Thomasclavelia]|uniref:Tryptophan-rich sensory protein n=1 Tax=Candidatus Erysipelatoclostridium merdavium TaxID=2838566 RepID=A0A9D2BP81_9FIRM|nr:MULTISPECIES: TspO/MBR family protein [unclassified Thomasclavelia]HIX82514.1 tryptophan-rich sensory protein [Candidatus Erysipelatoclostridium merdavium]
MIKLKKYKYIILNIAISLGIGGLSAFFTMNSMDIYQNINRPKLAPPGYIFPIVWTILYVLMGISSYLIHRSNHKNKETALIIYYFQLLINFSWPIFFFNYQNFLLALAILFILNILVIILIKVTYSINHLASYLLIPYLIWILFALYLNFWIFIHN